MKRLLTALSLAALTSASLVGCGAPPIAVYRVSDIVETSTERPREISGLTMVDERYERRDGRLFVQLIIKNERGGQARVEYQAEWYDAGGFRIGEPTPWSPLRLGAGETETLNFTGLTETAAIMELRLRNSQPID